jgi:hypothetical protein
MGRLAVVGINLLLILGVLFRKLVVEVLLTWVLEYYYGFLLQNAVYNIYKYLKFFIRKIAKFRKK